MVYSMESKFFAAGVVLHEPPSASNPYLHRVDLGDEVSWSPPLRNMIRVHKHPEDEVARRIKYARDDDLLFSRFHGNGRAVVLSHMRRFHLVVSVCFDQACRETRSSRERLA